jgi:hypothetical protein
MALWGKLDTLAASPKYITRKAYFGTAAVNITDNTIDLRGSNTDFATGDGVVYNANGGTTLGGLTSGNTYYAYQTAVSGVFKLSDTEANAKAGTNFVDLTGTGNAAQFLQRNAEGNESTAPGNGDHINNGMDLYFVDVNEAQQPENKARGLKSPGWWLYRSGTNADGSVYHHAECLIALGGQSDKLQATTGDAADDAVVVDATVSITTQPSNATVVEPATATFSVVAAITGAGSLTYQWQVQEGGAGAWANVTRGTGGTTASYTTGATQVAASGTADSNGDKYRCVVGATTGNTDVTTTAATLTVTA